MNNSRRLFHKLLTIQIHPIQMKTQNQSMKKKIFLIKFRAEKALMIYDMIWYDILEHISLHADIFRFTEKEYLIVLRLWLFFITF